VEGRRFTEDVEGVGEGAREMPQQVRQTLEQAERIDRVTVEADLEVDVGSRREAGIAAEADDLALRDIITDKHERRTHQMAVARGVAVTVVDLDRVSETAARVAARDDHAT